MCNNTQKAPKKLSQGLWAQFVTFYFLARKCSFLGAQMFGAQVFVAQTDGAQMFGAQTDGAQVTTLYLE